MMEKLLNVRLLMLLGILAFFGFVIATFFIRGNQPTPQSQPQYKQATTVVDTAQIHQIHDQQIAGLHWLNSNDLTYRRYNPTTKNVELVRTDGKSFTTLLSLPISVDGFFWSKNNDLLYASSNASQVIRLFPVSGSGTGSSILNGTAIAWSPDGTKIFSMQLTGNNQQTPTIYSIRSQTKSPLQATIPTYIDTAFWLDADTILLLGTDFENGTTTMYQLSASSNTATPVQLSRQLARPKLSPKASTILFASNDGLYTYNPTDGIKQVLATSSSPDLAFYDWIDEDHIVIASAQQVPATLTVIDLKNKTQTNYVLNIKLADSQKIQVAYSPNQAMIAIATDNEGLFFVDTASLKRPGN